MVHHRFNEKGTNSNNNINFISVLRDPWDEEQQDKARTLLRALAAQVKPIMKQHGFTVNSLEEYEFNVVFAGRNWNNGEVIELVLRKPNGSFYSSAHIINVFCHELAHIQHMNHSSPFQSLWRQLRTEVRALQVEGYFGDGFWSGGKDLNSMEVGGAGIMDNDDIPEYICGGAQAKSRSYGVRRRRAPKQPRPSNDTGAETKRKRKAGSRITAQGKFKGEGQSLNKDIQDEVQKKVGTGFKKQAGSKRAREERAVAAEKRIRTLQNAAKQVPFSEGGEQEHDSHGGLLSRESDEDSDSPLASLEETDEVRFRMMLDTVPQDEIDAIRGFEPNNMSKKPLRRKTVELTPKPRTVDSNREQGDPILSSDEELLVSKRLAKSPILQTTEISPRSLEPPSKKAKNNHDSDIQIELSSKIGPFIRSSIRGDRGNGSDETSRGAVSRKNSDRVLDGPISRETTESLTPSWSCLICTFDNPELYLICAACGIQRTDEWISGDL